MSQDTLAINAASKVIRVKTTRPYCGVGCGIDASVEGRGTQQQLIATSGIQ